MMLDEVRIERAGLLVLVGLNVFPVSRSQLPDTGCRILDLAAAPLAAHLRWLLLHSLEKTICFSTAAFTAHLAEIMLNNIRAAAPLAAHPRWRLFQSFQETTCFSAAAFTAHLAEIMPNNIRAAAPLAAHPRWRLFQSFQETTCFSAAAFTAHLAEIMPNNIRATASLTARSHQFLAHGLFAAAFSLAALSAVLDDIQLEIVNQQSLRSALDDVRELIVRSDHSLRGSRRLPGSRPGGLVRRFGQIQRRERRRQFMDVHAILQKGFLRIRQCLLNSIISIIGESRGFVAEYLHFTKQKALRCPNKRQHTGTFGVHGRRSHPAMDPQSVPGAM